MPPSSVRVLWFTAQPTAIYQWHCCPGFAVHELAELARRFARDGVLGTFFCGLGEQVDFCATLKLYDDGTQDIEALMGGLATLIR